VDWITVAFVTGSGMLVYLPRPTGKISKILGVVRGGLGPLVLRAGGERSIEP